MRIKKYSSDLPLNSWQYIEKIIEVRRKSKWDLQEIVNAILYLTKNGCVWRDIPGEFPSWITVYWYYQKWVSDGTWKRISDCLTIDYREKEGKKVQPTAVIIDSQSCKNSLTCVKNVGIDGGKLIKGRKRFFIVDTIGNLIESFVVSANCYDGTTAFEYWESLSCTNILMDNIAKIYADGTFGGTFSRKMNEKYDISVEIPKTPIAQKGKVQIHEKRWIVERTIAWTNNNRRCSKDYERKVNHANAFIVIANIRRLLTKIT